MSNILNSASIVMLCLAIMVVIVSAHKNKHNISALEIRLSALENKLKEADK